jgi:hypothetical protein
MDMVNEALGSYGNNLIIAVVGVGVALIGLAIVLWLIKRRGGSSPFIRGGRNRQPRLQVLDAAAVDARRRLVLVRRDNVEHLVMIGGPTDIVIESGIGAIPVLTPVDQRDNLLSSSPYDDERQEQVEKRESPRTISQTREVTHEQPVRAAPIVTPAPVAAPIVTPAPTPAPTAAAAPERTPVITPPPVVASAPVSAPAPIITPPPVVPPVITPAAPVVTPTAAAPSVSKEPAVSRPAPSVEPASEAPRSFRQEPPAVAPASAPVSASPASSIQPPIAPSVPSPAAAPVAGPIAPPVIDRPPVVVAAAPVAAAAAPVVAPPDVVPPIKPAAVTQSVEPSPILNDPRFSLDDISAEDILESARSRVLPNREPVETPIKPTAPAPAPAAPNDALSNDFEKFLEAEMAKSAPAAEQSFAQAASTQQQPRRDPAAPPISGASTENEIQKEMARIFGEMSVTRDR